MTKGIFRTIIVCGCFAATLTSCGAKYTPMTDDVKKAKADSIYNVQSAQVAAQKDSACQATMTASVDAKVKQMQDAATASAEPKK